MKKKTIVLIATVVMLSAALIFGGTLAYFTDSQEATNTFTVGNVSIKLDEAVVDANGKATNERTEEGVSYRLNPGVAVDKDPTVTNTGANAAYVRMKVTLSDAAAFQEAVPAGTDLATIFGGFDSSKWTRVGDPDYNSEADTLTYTYNYNTKMAKDAQATLFTTVTLPASFTSKNAKDLGEDGFTITVTADAIQADGFDSVTEAFAAFTA